MKNKRRRKITMKKLIIVFPLFLATIIHAMNEPSSSSSSSNKATSTSSPLADQAADQANEFNEIVKKLVSLREEQARADDLEKLLACKIKVYNLHFAARKKLFKNKKEQEDLINAIKENSDELTRHIYRYQKERKKLYTATITKPPARTQAVSIEDVFAQNLSRPIVFGKPLKTEEALELRKIILSKILKSV